MAEINRVSVQKVKVIKETPFKKSVAQGDISGGTAEVGAVFEVSDFKANHFQLLDGRWLFAKDVQRLYDGRSFTVSGKRYYLAQPVVEGTNFTWAEVTRNGERIPPNSTVMRNAERMATELQKIRNHYNQPITITSWYRDPDTNRRVGGASRSTHLEGHGVDIQIQGIPPQQVQRWVETWWTGGLGYGKRFTHLDLGRRRRWNY